MPCCNAIHILTKSGPLPHELVKGQDQTQGDPLEKRNLLSFSLSKGLRQRGGGSGLLEVSPRRPAFLAKPGLSFPHEILLGLLAKG